MNEAGRSSMRGARPVLVVGASGQVGGCLVRAWRALGAEVVGTHCAHPRPDTVALDAGDPDRVLALAREVQPRLIVNSLNAQGGTDACEVDPALATRAHLGTATHLADAAAAVGAGLVQVSTDYVFDGRDGPYDEQAAPSPLSRLGQAKVDAERYAMARVPSALIVRTSFVFSWTPESATKNFVMQLLDAHGRGQSMRVPIDQVGNVTYAPNLAEAIVELAEAGVPGIVHVAGTTRCSKYVWALRAAGRFGLDAGLIEGVTTEALRQAGPRPLASGFILRKAQALLRRTRLLSLDDGLDAMAAHMAPVAQPA
jgi:dTDP-4-dehydrorhamnose reductase